MYNFKDVALLNRVATDFCKLDKVSKVWIGAEFDLINANDANLSDGDLEIKIWDGIMKSGKLEQFILAIGHYLLQEKKA